MNRLLKHLVTFIGVALLLCEFASSSELAQLALREAGRKKGICVVLGETDGKLTAAIAAGSEFYVQGCAIRSGGVPAARKALVAAGVVARSSIIAREDKGLPYADNLLNLLVAENLAGSGVGVDEVLRVLAPGGVAVLGGADGSTTAFKKVGAKNTRTDGKYLVFTKPLDPNMGQWTHIKGGADQSYTSNDRLVGPWKEVRWIASPRWGALYMSYSGLVSAGGRIYYRENRRSKGTSRWQLVCRDAYNGIQLWRDFSGSAMRRYPAYTDYTLCCDEKNVYLVEDKTLIARDGVSGKRIKEYSAGFMPNWVTSTGQWLVCSARGIASVTDKASGKMLWKRQSRGHPAADGKLAFVVTGDVLEGVGLAAGASRWKGKIVGMPAKVSAAFTVEIKCKGGVVYVVAQEKYKPIGLLAAHDAKNGKQLWKRSGKYSHGVLPFEKEVWLMNRKGKGDNMLALKLDARTGKELKSYRPKGTVMSKCWGARAADDYVMYSNGRYLDRKTGQHLGNTSTRSPCGLGQNPANGLTYFMPHHCDCGVTIRGFMALSTPGSRKWVAGEGNTRLFKGNANTSGGAESATEWPTYRADIKRSNSRKATLPAGVKKLWSQKLGAGALTQATGAYGMIYAAERKAGRLLARDAASGKDRWSFTADGRVEYPPTLSSGRCLFGTGAGSLYCLDAKNGKLIWRLRVAPAQKFIGDHERLDSPWPVNGSVLVVKGMAYVSAGRSSSQSGGGLWHLAVDIASGTVKWRNRANGAGDMFVSDGAILRSAMSFYKPADGKKPWPKPKVKGLLATTRYLGSVSVTDYMATVEPNLSSKKHIELTDGRIRGDCIAFSKETSVAGWRYNPGVPGWKDKDKTNKWFLHAAGGAKWNLHDIKQHVMGIVIAGDKAYIAGQPTSYDPQGKSELWVVSLADGKILQTTTLQGIPIYDGLSAVGDKLYVATEGGALTCYGK